MTDRLAAAQRNAHFDSYQFARGVRAMLRAKELERGSWQAFRNGVVLASSVMLAMFVVVLVLA